MFVRLLLLFTLVPIAELFLFLYVGQVIGIVYTITIILATGLLGVILARSQGFAVFKKAKEQLNQGQIPGDQLIDGIFVLAGSLLLLTPGLITDTLGFVFLIPASRYPIREFIKKKIRKGLDTGSINLVFRKF